MLPARRVAGFLHVQSEIDLVREHLHVTLWLHPAAHHTERFPRLAILYDESRDDSVKRTFARRVNVRMARLHREKFAAILKHEAKSRYDDSAAHASVVALNEADHVAFVIGRAQINRVALIERRIS